MVLFERNVMAFATFVGAFARRSGTLEATMLLFDLLYFVRLVFILVGMYLGVMIFMVILRVCLCVNLFVSLSVRWCKVVLFASYENVGYFCGWMLVMEFMMMMCVGFCGVFVFMRWGKSVIVNCYVFMMFSWYVFTKFLSSWFFNSVF